MSELKGGEIGEGLVPFFDALFEAAQENSGKLSEWERSFITDVGARYGQLESSAAFRCSAKQWEVLSRIGRKLGVEP